MDEDCILRDEQLCKEVKAFVNQEVQHSAEHASYNKNIGREYNHNMQKIDNLVKGIFWILEECPFIPNRRHACLGVTCSLEHLTATLAEILLTTKEGRRALDLMSPSHRTMWVWHAIEEIEHKSVAFDVSVAVGGSYVARIYRHIVTLIIFVAVLIYLNLLFLFDRGGWRHAYELCSVLWFLCISPGVLQSFPLRWLKYMHPDFTPWGHSKAEISALRNAIAHWTAEMNLPSSSTGK